MPVLSVCNFEEFYNFQDDDVAAVKEGSLSIHRLRRSLDDSHSREIITLKMEIQQIMKGIAAVWNEMCHSNLSH
jgi:glucosamine 6-phosphate synthetase-like amidotransferase/phosphosugar isomerase protein